MNISRCRFCGKKINKFYRKDTLFCSDKCRKRHYDLDRRPEANKKAVKEFKAVVEKEEDTL